MAVLAIVITALFVAAVVGVAWVGGRRLSHVFGPAPYGDDLDDDDTAAGVREPRRPPPMSGTAAAAADLDEHAA